MELIQTILILIGCALSLPVYWWLFARPFIRLRSQYRAGKSKLKRLEPPET